MNARTFTGTTWLVLVLMLAGCAAPPSAPQAQGRTSESRQQAGPKRITAAISGEPVILSETARQGGPSTVGTQLEDLINAGLARLDDQGLLHPQIAGAVPSLENGLWRLFPDGRMETTWKLRSRVTWHDGTPFTTDDLLFTAVLEQDREVPRASRNVAYDTIDHVGAPDAETITILWNRPFIHADRMFTRAFTFAPPMPKHILERAYIEDKATLMQQPYWLTEFVGTGPYRLREFVRGSHLVLEANPAYILGQPKIDEIEVKFVQDSNALMANVLAGTVELTFGAGFSIDQALQVREQWRAGRVDAGPGNWIALWAQLLNPNPPIVANLQFRRALYHAIDRQQMADTLMYGLTSVAHSFMDPNQPAYREIEARLIRYEYDPRKAREMIQALGYTRGPDGFFRSDLSERPDSSGRDASTRRLAVELRTTSRPEMQQNAMLAVADYWQQIGAGVEPLVVPIQRALDGEYRATYPGFELLAGGPHDLEGIGQYHGSKARVPENNFVGSNRSRYMNPEFDALIEQYLVTVPRQERMQILGQIIYHISENLNVMPLVYGASFIMVGDRIVGVGPQKAPGSSMLWNSHEWDVK